MKVLRLLLAVITMVVLCFAYAPAVRAEQGSAWIELNVSKSSVVVGEEFYVSVYITGQNNSQLGKASISLESWYPGDPNPRGYEFVRFDASGDFPINNGQSVYTGTNSYQCRSVNMQANADMTGRHLFGRYVFRAVNPGSYGFSPASPCRNVIESLSGNWSFVWDYGGNYYITVSKPAQSTPPATSLSGGTSSRSSSSANTPSSTTRGSGANTATGGNSRNDNAAVQGETTTTATETKQGDKPTKSSAKKPNSKNWLPLVLLPLAPLSLAAWRFRKILLSRARNIKNSLGKFKSTLFDKKI